MRFIRQKVFYFVVKSFKSTQNVVNIVATVKRFYLSKMTFERPIKKKE